MKYFLFFAIASVLIPGVAWLSAGSRAWRRRWLTLLVFSPFLGAAGAINFFSMESYRGPDRGFEVTLTDLVAAGLFCAPLVGGPRTRLLFPPGTLPFLTLGVLALASTLVSPIPLCSSFTLFKLGRCALLYWVMVNLLEHEPDLTAYRHGWVAMGLAMTAIALYQKYLLGLYRIPGPFDHSNTIPLFLNLVAPVLLAWGLADARLSRISSISCTAASLGMLFAVVATYSRAGMVLAGGALGAVTLWVNLRATSRRSAGTGCLLLVLMILGGLKASGNILRRFQEAPEASAIAREEFNQVARAMAEDQPFGVGLNAFSHAMTNSPRYREHLSAMANEEHAGVAHHIYLLTAAEMGRAGLLAFLAVLLRFFWIAARAAARGSSLESMLAGGLVLGMTCLHLSGFLEWAFRITPVSYQFTLAAALAVSLDRRTRPAPAPAGTEVAGRDPLSPRPAGPPATGTGNAPR